MQEIKLKNKTVLNENAVKEFNKYNSIPTIIIYLALTLIVIAIGVVYLINKDKMGYTYIIVGGIILAISPLYFRSKLKKKTTEYIVNKEGVETHSTFMTDRIKVEHIFNGKVLKEQYIYIADTYKAVFKKEFVFIYATAKVLILNVKRFTEGNEKEFRDYLTENKIKIK